MASYLTPPTESSKSVLGLTYDSRKVAYCLLDHRRRVVQWRVDLHGVSLKEKNAGYAYKIKQMYATLPDFDVAVQTRCDLRSGRFGPAQVGNLLVVAMAVLLLTNQPQKTFRDVPDNAVTVAFSRDPSIPHFTVIKRFLFDPSCGPIFGHHIDHYLSCDDSDQQLLAAAYLKALYASEEIRKGN